MLMVHIYDITLTFFNNKPFNELIRRGHIYIAQPPLYKIKTGKTVTYLRNDQDLEKLAIKNSIDKIQNIEFKKIEILILIKISLTNVMNYMI